MIKALFKFTKNIQRGAPAIAFGQPCVVIDITSNSGQFRELSPFVLPAPPARNFENLWQFSKVYPCHVNANGEPTEEWDKWSMQGWADTKAHRYPMGKGAKPLYSFWQGKHLGYIEARKQIYIPEYVKNVIVTDSYYRLYEVYKQHNVILLDYDAYDHEGLGMTLKDVVNEPRRKMGHAFVLVMMLTGCLEECIARNA